MAVKVLITGTGQLGTALMNVHETGYWSIITTKEGLDITDEAKVLAFFQQYHFDYCINTAAYTDVDGCEINQDQNRRVNRDGVGILARACQDSGAYLIHISTDYVFDGLTTKPYTTESPVRPLNAYGLVKYQGEQEAFKYCEKTIIVRTSWLYYEYHANFPQAILKLAKAKKSLKVVDDQFGSPTYAGDLASALSPMIKQLTRSKHTLTGVYHFCNEGVISRYDFAKAICQDYALDVAIESIKTKDYPTPAKRPLYSALDTTKIRQVFKLKPRSWQKAFETFRLRYQI